MVLVQISCLPLLGAGPQTPEIYRFMPNGTRQYIVLDAMDDRAAVRTDPSAMAGAYAVLGVDRDIGCLCIMPLGDKR